EQIIPALGLSVAIQQPEAPGGDDDGTYNNGIITSEIIYDDPSKEWWSGIADDKSYSPYNWILAGTNNNPTEEPATLYPDQSGDSKGYFEDIVEGTWGPYMYASGNNRLVVNGFDNYGMGPAVTIGRNLNDASDLHSVDIVFTADKNNWTRVPVFELAEEPGLSEHGDKKLTQRQDTSWTLSNGELKRAPNLAPGWSYFPGYAIDVESGKRLNMAFGENSWLPGENGNDMLWNPTDREFLPPGNNVNGGYVFGGQHYIYVFADEDRIGGTLEDLEYKGGAIADWPLTDIMEDLVKTGGLGNIARANFWRACRWIGMPTLRRGMEFDPYTELPTETRIRIRMNTPYQKRELASASNEGKPEFLFNTSNIATKTYVDSVGSSKLETIRVVPNPYYGFSSYETSQLDNIVKITNLPEICTISIFTPSGTLIRQYRKDNSMTYLEWDLKNAYNVPIASGVYIIHIDAGDLGEKIVKWFGALRPVDLNSF
ncbi:MAG: T9SS type A sorting domain-containing protein, partial [Flavobacteriales bacterium]